MLTARPEFTVVSHCCRRKALHFARYKSFPLGILERQSYLRTKALMFTRIVNTKPRVFCVNYEFFEKGIYRFQNILSNLEKNILVEGNRSQLRPICKCKNYLRISKQELLLLMIRQETVTIITKISLSLWYQHFWNYYIFQEMLWVQCCLNKMEISFLFGICAPVMAVEVFLRCQRSVISVNNEYEAYFNILLEPFSTFSI